MPLTPDAVTHLQAAGHDAVHASRVGLSEASDKDILAFARLQGRIVVTADLDYPRLLAIQQADGPGLVLFRGGAYSDVEMLAVLDRVLARAGDFDLEHSILVVDRSRIRRRSLGQQG